MSERVPLNFHLIADIKAGSESLFKSFSAEEDDDVMVILYH